MRKFFFCTSSMDVGKHWLVPAGDWNDDPPVASPGLHSGQTATLASTLLLWRSLTAAESSHIYRISSKMTYFDIFSVNNLGSKVDPCGTPHIISRRETLYHLFANLVLTLWLHTFAVFVSEYCDQLDENLSLNHWKHCIMYYCQLFLLTLIALKP